MEYKEARGQIKSGDILAFTHHEWDSLYDLQVQAVRIFTQSEYCHVCVAWVFAGRVFVIEAVTPVVRIVPLSNIMKDGVYWIPTDKEMTDEELEFAMKEVGLGAYSKFQAIAGQLQTLEIGEDNNWQCAELTIAMRQKSGLDLSPKATPAAVVQKALELGYELNFIKP